jgi:hypothetical protein
MRFILGLALISVLATGAAAQDDAAVEAEAESDIWEEIRGLYERAKETGERVPGDVADWLKEDLASIGDWEYRLLSLSSSSDETVEAKLNELGAERWECFAVLHAGGRTRLFLKRPARSFLTHIPIADLWKLVPTGGDDTGE